jgi:hypothetical protein
MTSKPVDIVYVVDNSAALCASLSDAYPDIYINVMEYAPRLSMPAGYMLVTNSRVAASRLREIQSYCRGWISSKSE